MLALSRKRRTTTRIQVRHHNHTTLSLYHLSDCTADNFTSRSTRRENEPQCCSIVCSRHIHTQHSNILIEQVKTRLRPPHLHLERSKDQCFLPLLAVRCGARNGFLIRIDESISNGRFFHHPRLKPSVRPFFRPSIHARDAERNECELPFLPPVSPFRRVRIWHACYVQAAHARARVLSRLKRCHLH